MGADELPHSIGTGTVHVFGVDLVFHNLSDGSRIIEADSLAAFLEAMSLSNAEPGDMEGLARIIQGGP